MPRAALLVQALPRSSLQLLSVACMLIACKHEEVSERGCAACTLLGAHAVVLPLCALLVGLTHGGAEGVHAAAGAVPLCAGVHQHRGQLLSGAQTFTSLCGLHDRREWPRSIATVMGRQGLIITLQPVWQPARGQPVMHRRCGLDVNVSCSGCSDARGWLSRRQGI